MGDFEGKYGSSSENSANGTYFSDTVTLGNATVVAQVVALVDSILPSLPKPGMIGIGYEEDESIVSDSMGTSYPNLISSLQEQGIIAKKMYSILLGPVSTSHSCSTRFDQRVTKNR